MGKTLVVAADSVLAGTKAQRAAACRSIRSRALTLGPPIDGEEHEWYNRIAADYQEALGTIGLVGFWILEDRDGDDAWISGLSIGCPDGERVEIPDLLTSEKEAAFAARIVDFFARLTAHRAPPAPVVVQGRRAPK